MDHFTGVNETERYNNDLLNEMRKTNQLMEENNNVLKQLILKIDAKPTQQTKPQVNKTQTQRRKP